MHLSMSTGLVDFKSNIYKWGNGGEGLGGEWA